MLNVRGTYWVKQDQSVRTNKVDTTSTGFRTEQKNELLALGVIEPRYDLRSLVDVHRTVKADTAIPEIDRLASQIRDDKKLRTSSSCTASPSGRVSG